jgi:Domain of unknown function (DUF4148)
MSVWHRTRLGVLEPTTKGHAMTRLPFKVTTIALLIAAATAGAHAQDSGAKTREQVRRDLYEAMRNGTLPHGEQDAPLRQQNGGARVATRSRADVQAEFDAARRNGELLAGGESSQTMGEAHPSQYRAYTVVASKSRAQVKAELAQAQRDGDMVAGGEAGLTLREQHPDAYPRAAASTYAAASAPMPARMR